MITALIAAAVLHHHASAGATSPVISSAPSLCLLLPALPGCVSSSAPYPHLPVISTAPPLPPRQR